MPRIDRQLSVRSAKAGTTGCWPSTRRAGGEEASLTSTERLIEQARQRDFDVPAPQDEIYVDSKSVLNADAR